MGIKINLSVIKTDGQHITIELNHNDSILVDNIGIETKSVIIQKKKGNIDISDELTTGMIPYQKYIHEPVVEIAKPIEYMSSENPVTDVKDLIEDTTTESESVIIEPLITNTDSLINSVVESKTVKGGRPKGAKNKPKKKVKRKSKHDRMKGR